MTINNSTTTFKEATKLLKMNDQAIWLKGLEKEQTEATQMAIRSLEAWENVKEEIKNKANKIKNIRSDGQCFFTEQDIIDIIDEYIKEIKNVNNQDR